MMDGVSIEKIEKFVEYPPDLNPFLSDTENGCCAIYLICCSSILKIPY